MNRFTTTVLVFLVALLLGIFVVWPKYQELKTKGSEILQKDADLKILVKSRDDFHLLAEELNKYSNELAKIDKALPTKFSLPSFLNYLQKTSAINGLNFKDYTLSVSSLSDEEAGSLKELRFAINLSGDYPSLKTIISDLEKNERLIEIEEVSFSSSRKKETEGQAERQTEPYIFTLGIKIYSY